MPADVTVTSADLSDPRVRRLVEPGSLPVLMHGDHAASVVQVKSVPVAVAAAALRGEQADLLSLACIEGAWATPAPGWAIADLRRRVARLVFESFEPVPEHVAAALRAGGLVDTGPRWSWFEFIEEQVRVQRPGIEVPLTIVRLDQAHPVGYEPHPDDLGASPVLMDGSAPVAYAVLRTAAVGTVLQWVWVDPARRRQGLVIGLCAAVIDAVPSHPLRFRVRQQNEQMRHVIDGWPTPVVRHLWDTPTWVG